MFIRNRLRFQLQRAPQPVSEASVLSYINDYFRPKAGADPSALIEDILPTQNEGLAEGYVFQDFTISQLEQQSDLVVGWRVQGGISEANRRHLLTRETYCGPIFRSTLRKASVPSQSLSLKDMQGLDLELQVAFEVESEIPLLTSLADIYKHLGSMYPAVEVMASRLPFRAASVPTHVADLAGCGAVYLGDPIPKAQWEPSKDTFAEWAAVLFRGQDPCVVGRCSNVVGTPMTAIKYLARHLPTRKRSLRPGDIVLTGSWGATQALPGNYWGHFGPFGKVSITIVE